MRAYGRNSLIGMSHPVMRALRRRGLLNERELRDLEIRSFFDAGKEAGRKSVDLYDDLRERYNISYALVQMILYSKRYLPKK